ncbi:chitinase [Cystobacter fuscus]|uniref:chitinase n=1 Tax=Cystobacter fuscus TaxID=43 RepID=A0A250IV65_9BACT|nr:glycosyl hydrolase family 18 protein [Cystobacter fuscus]ATB35645.1 chitinase [Cystobacter fuscus]
MYSSSRTRGSRPGSFILAAAMALLFGLSPTLASAAARGEWAPNVGYAQGDSVTYSGKGYDCRQAHTSLVGWEPPNVPALWLEGSSVPTDTQAPTAPSSLRSTATSSNSVSLAWTGSTDNVAVTGYEVSFSGGGASGTATSTTTSATISGLQANTTYTFSVKARDAAGNRSAASAALSVTTPPNIADTQAPTAPSSLRSTATGSDNVSLAWTGSTDNVAVTGYELFTGASTTASATSTTTSATVSGLKANTTYTFTVKARDAAGNRSTASNSISVTTTNTPPASTGKVIVGYWHNFDNGSTNIRLRDISPKFNVIQVAFAEPVGGSTTGNMAFSPYNATVADFKADIAYLKSQGKKVLISLGGANGTVDLATSTAKQNFVTTMQSIIDTYGFDGMDIDLEGSSLSLNGGDTDFRNPTTPKITNLIDGVRQILSRYGSGFLLTMAPETAYVQGGYSAYGGPWGAYLPVIYAFRDRLTYLHVQHYNTGTVTALDGRAYAQGTADFHVAMAEMLLQGFPVGGNASNIFPALRPDQVVIGLPSSPQAAGGGYTTPANVQKALGYLIKGQSFGGGYVLRKSSGYPDFKGLMTWSINWDKFTNYEFSNSHRAYLDSL